MEATDDFITDYWKLRIKEQKLEKKYYKQVAAILNPVRAAEFFAIEDYYVSTLRRNRLAKIGEELEYLEPAYRNHWE